MTYRWLDGDELAMLDPIIASRSWTPINRKCARALIAEESGELRGFLIVRLVEHTEPLWVAPDSRGGEMQIASELSRKMAEYLRSHNVRGWMAQCDSPYAVELCEQNGMTRIESPVYKGGC